MGLIVPERRSVGILAGEDRPESTRGILFQDHADEPPDEEPDVLEELERSYRVLSRRSALAWPEGWPPGWYISPTGLLPPDWDDPSRIWYVSPEALREAIYSGPPDYVPGALLLYRAWRRGWKIQRATATALEGATLSGLAEAITGDANDYKFLDLKRDPKTLRVGDTVNIMPLLRKAAGKRDQPPKVEQSWPMTGASSEFVRKLRDFIAHWEGRSRRVYKDTKGNWTIGVGYNLSGRKKEEIERLLPGVKRDDLISGRTELTDDQVDLLFDYTISEDLRKAKNWIPNLDDHPEAVKLIIIDFAHNVRNVWDWPKLREALRGKDYSGAAKEMDEPRYVDATKRRARHHIAVLEELGRAQKESVGQ